MAIIALFTLLAIVRVLVPVAAETGLIGFARSLVIQMTGLATGFLVRTP